jgi:hypothetical protein
MFYFHSSNWLFIWAYNFLDMLRLQLHISSRIYFYIGGRIFSNSKSPQTVQGLRLALSNGPNRVGVSHHVTRGRKQVQFPTKRCVLKNTVRWIKTKTPVILSVTHHHKTPLESTLLLIMFSSHAQYV